MNIIQVHYHKKNYKHKKLRDEHLRKDYCAEVSYSKEVSCRSGEIA